MSITRIYHHHERWEEGPMWRNVTAQARRRYATLACQLMKDSERFQDSMRQALRNWPISCEHNLSNTANNRLAWLGHAGCYAFTESPEDATRLGWRALKPAEQDEANRVAQEVINEWEAAYAQAQVGA